MTTESEALAIAWSQREQHGVTRVANVTQLDRIGIPCVNTTRPTAVTGNLTVSAGKGRTMESATLGSLMECYERFYSEIHHAQVQRRVAAPLGAHVVDLRALNPNVAVLKELGSNPPHGWVAGTELSAGNEVWVPDIAVFTPCDLPYADLFGGASHGLAAGTDDESTITRGLLELIERDAYSIGLLNKSGFEIALDSIPHRQRVLADLLIAAGIDLRIYELWSDLAIPAYFAIGIDEEAPRSLLVAAGAASNLSSSDALEGALLELAQSRVSIISGAREDFAASEWMNRSNAPYLTTTQRARKWMDGWQKVDFTRRHYLPELNPLDALQQVFSDADLPAPITVQLSPLDSPIRTHKVLVPGLEVCGYDSYRPGIRMMKSRLRKQRAAHA